MKEEINNLIGQIIGKPSCRKKVGRMRSLSLGFGEKVYHGNFQLSDEFYGEWEVGTYYSAWRIIRDEKILCGSQDVVDSIDELNTALNKIEFGYLVSLKQITNFDVRLEFDNGIVVDFLATISDEDQCFHIFFPNKLVIVFSITGGWEVGASNKPWGKGETIEKLKPTSQ